MGRKFIVIKNTGLIYDEYNEIGEVVSFDELKRIEKHLWEHTIDDENTFGSIMDYFQEISPAEEILKEIINKKDSNNSSIVDIDEFESGSNPDNFKNVFGMLFKQAPEGTLFGIQLTKEQFDYLKELENET